MRILICATEAPLPPTNGFRVALTGLLGELCRAHEVRVLAFRLPDQGNEHSALDLRCVPRPKSGLMSDAPALVVAAVRRRPLVVDRLASQMCGPLCEELEGFRPDVVHVSSGRLAALGAALATQPSVLAALDAWHLNVEARRQLATGARRRLLGVEARHVRRFEATTYRRFRRVTVVTDADRAALLQHDPSLRITVIPNGIDADHYAALPEVAEDPRLLLFTGAMGYPPNVTAAVFLARRVFPLVRAVRPDVRLAIVGRNPAPEVMALGALDGVEVTGEVPDLRPWLSGSRVYVCPMRTGTGIKNKLLEAMASGVACVGTPLAMQGLGVVNGVQALVGRDEEEFVGHVLRVLADAGLARRLGNAGQQHVRSHFTWGAVARAYERVYAEAGAGSSL